jgi:hypothetical protein
MQPPRFTIGRVMVWVAAVAFLLAIPRLVTSPELLVTLAIVGMLAALVLLNGLAGMVFGLRCPACSRRTLRRLARHRHYYRCAACRVRLKRFGYGPWLDASGPEDTARYRKPTEAGSWKGFEAPEELDGTTSGRLLRNKRSRGGPAEEPRPTTPPGPGRRLEEAKRKLRSVLNEWRDLRGRPIAKPPCPTPPPQRLWDRDLDC